MANAIEQKVDVSGAVGDLRLIVEQRPDPHEGKKPHSDNPVSRDLSGLTGRKGNSNFPSRFRRVEKNSRLLVILGYFLDRLEQEMARLVL